MIDNKLKDLKEYSEEDLNEMADYAKKYFSEVEIRK